MMAGDEQTVAGSMGRRWREWLARGAGICFVLGRGAWIMQLRPHWIDRHSNKDPQPDTATLANGAHVNEIHADRIVLARNGAHETLMIEIDAASKVSRAAAINEQRAGKGYEILAPTFADA